MNESGTMTASAPSPTSATDRIRSKIRRLELLGDAPAKSGAWVLARFLDTPRTEAAFYLAFQRLGATERRVLIDWWQTDEWGAFRRLCRFYAV